MENWIFSQRYYKYDVVYMSKSAGYSKLIASLRLINNINIYIIERIILDIDKLGTDIC